MYVVTGTSWDGHSTVV